MSLKKLLTKITSLTNKLNKKGNPPFLVIVLFAALFALFSYSILRDTAAWGYLQNVIAAVTGTTNSQTFTQALDLPNPPVVEDAYGRCILTNPRNKKTPTQKVSQAGRSVAELESKSGLNQGILVANNGGQDAKDTIDYMTGQSKTKGSQDFGMSYVLGIAMGPAEANYATSFIKYANEQGIMPIIRLCYPSPSCQFKIGDRDSIYRFYKTVNESLTGDEAFIGVVGPNEPGTASEMESFGVSHGDYKSLIDWANYTAEKLQNYRIEDSVDGHMYIAPVIFNLSNSQDDDVKGYLYSNPQINYDLFDYLIGNTYDLMEIGRTAESFYDDKDGGRSVKQRIEEHDNLQMIISEFGFFPNSHIPTTAQKLQAGIGAMKDSYNNLCNDDTVDGILFFRPFPDDELKSPAPKQDPAVPANDVMDIISDCSEVPKKTSQSSSWLNCNFDSAIYQSNVKFTGSTNVVSGSIYSLGDTAKMCAIIKGKTLDKYAKLGDSQTEKPAYLPDAFNAGVAAASSYWPLGNDPDTNPIFANSRSAAKNLFDHTVKGDIPQTADLWASVIMYGTNDCGGVALSDFINNIETIGNAYEHRGKIPIISTFPERNIPVATAHNLPSCQNTTDTYNQALIQLANKHGWPLRRADLIVQLSDLGPDGLHIINYDNLNSVTSNLLQSLKSACAGNTPSQANSSNITNTNQDSTTGTSNSLATSKPFFTEYKKDYPDPKKAAHLKVVCANNNCNARAEKTIQVSLPIKNVGNNSSFGSVARRYSPICPTVASFMSDPRFDALNQFAGQLIDSNGYSYPMPWLGSAINCASQLNLYGPDFARFTDLSVISNPGALSGWADKEVASDTARNINLFKDQSGNPVPDEKLTCLVDPKSKDTLSCLSNDQLALINAQGVYKPISGRKYLAPNTDPKRMIFISDNNDYIPGPELVTDSQDTVWSGNGGDVCKVYATRNTNHKDTTLKVVGDINCKVIPTNTVKIQGVKVACTRLVTNSCIGQGTCRATDSSIYEACVQYNQAPSDKVYAYTNDYGSAPSYNITQVYDAIYRMYQQFETQMSQRNLKVVVEENLGWRANVDLVIRDLNDPANYGPYLYSGTPEEYSSDGIDTGGINLSGSVNPSLPINFFDNKSALAKGNPRKTDYQYHDWIGYFDQLQEWMQVYTNNTRLSGEKSIPNPFYGAGPLNQPEVASVDSAQLQNDRNQVGAQTDTQAQNVDLTNQCSVSDVDNAIASTAQNLLTGIEPGYDGLYNRPTQPEFSTKFWARNSACPNNANAINCKYNWYCGNPGYPACAVDSITGKPETNQYEDMTWCTWLVNQSYSKVFPDIKWPNFPSVYYMKNNWNKYFGALLPVEQANQIGFENNPVPVGSAIFYSKPNDPYAHVGIVCGIDLARGELTTCETNAGVKTRKLKIVDLNGKKVLVTEVGVNNLSVSAFGLPPGKQSGGQCIAQGDNGIGAIGSLNDAPNKDEQNVLVAGTAGQFTSSPLLSCDQVEVCRRLSRTSLINDLHLTPEVAEALCPLDSMDPNNPHSPALPSTAPINCIANRSDTRFDNQNLLQKELCNRGYSIEGVCENKCVEVPVNNDNENVTSVPTSLNKGGVAISIPLDNTQFFVTPSNGNHSDSILNFAQTYGTDFAINGNFFTGSHKPLGFYGGEGQIDYNPAGSDEYALVFSSSDPSGGDVRLKSKIVAQAGQAYIIDVKPADGFTAGDAASLSKNITLAVSGFPLLVNNGVQFTNGGSYKGGNDPVPRTIVGWKADGKTLVMSVVQYATFNQLADIAKNELNLQYAIALDGGSSSEMYSKSGFSADLKLNNLVGGNKVYLPESNGTSDPTNVAIYFGVKLGASTPSLTKTVCTPVNNNNLTLSSDLFADVPGTKVPLKDPISGVQGLSCNIDILDTNDVPDWNKLEPFAKALSLYYNSDGDAYSTSVDDKDLRNFIINYSMRKGLNPKFVTTLWLEESAGSTLGAYDMGCIYRNSSADTNPTCQHDPVRLSALQAGGSSVGLVCEDTHGDQTKDQKLSLLKEQIDCIAEKQYTQSDNFQAFMCSYSGEKDRPMCKEFINNPNFPKNVCWYYNLLNI